MDIETAEEFTNSWYNLYRRVIPNMHSYNFPAFAGKAAGLVTAIAGKVGAEYTTVFANEAAAYVDQHRCKITIPTWYFDSKRYVERFGEDVADNVIAIATLNGTLIHESRHIKFSPGTTTEILAMTYEGSNAAKNYGRLANSAANIVEDLFIEAGLRQPYSTFTTIKNFVLFSEETFESAAMEFDGTLAAGINLAVFYKRIDLRESENFAVLPKKALEVLERSVDANLSLSDRSKLTAEFCNCFPVPEETEEPSESDKKFAGGDGEDSSEISRKEKGDSKAVAAIAGKVEGEFKKEHDANSKRVKFDIDGLTIDVSKMEVSDVMTYLHKESRYDDLSTNGAFKFFEELKSLRTKNHTTGEPTCRGPRFVSTRISRIATDGKIFAYQNSEREENKRVEVVIVVDASGSMNDHYDSADFGGYNQLFPMALASGKEIFAALRNAGIACAVVAHTSFKNDRAARETPSLIKIVSNDMADANTLNINTRFSEARRISLRQNYDGFAIEEAAKLFTNRPARKVMIVISDGAPYSNDYFGKSAYSHTKEVIGKARAQGIGVISLSIVEGVVDDNDRIYGKEWNIDGSQSMVAQLRNLIKKISQ